jgi:hypothetical protein
MIGLLFHPESLISADDIDYIGYFIDLVYKYQDNSTLGKAYYDLNRAAYTAQFAVATNNTAASWASDAFDFCGFDCSIINILVSDPSSLGVTEYAYQLSNGSCSNPFVLDYW